MATAPSAKSVTVLRDEGEALSALAAEKRLGLDIETSGLSPWNDVVAVVSLYGPESNVAAILHCRGHISPRLSAFLERPGIVLVGHNVAGFDALFLHNAGVNVFNAFWYDTMVSEGATLASGRRNISVSLKATLERRLGKKIKKDPTLHNWMLPSLSPEQLEYCVDDVRMLPGLMDAQLEKVGGTPARQAIQLETAILPVTMRMTLNGLPLHRGRFYEWRERQAKEYAETANELHGLLGPINLGSPIQLRKALAEFGIPLPNTMNNTLVSASATGGRTGELLRTLIRNRHAGQRLKMYKDDWVDEHVRDWRVHARFWQVNTETMRFTSSNPNLQQIPQDMRGCFGWEGQVVVAADYSQIEVVLAAVISRDARMLAAVKSGDLHREVAAVIWNTSPDSISDERRQLAKAMNFTLIFGGGWETLYEYARLSGSDISRDGAQEAHRLYFERFPGMKAMREQAAYAARRGYPVSVQLPSGSKRVLVGAELTATRILNTRIQGSAACGLKYAIAETKKSGTWSELGATVHDELVAGDLRPEHAQEYAEQLKLDMQAGMRRITGFDVKVGVKVGERWEK